VSPEPGWSAPLPDCVRVCLEERVERATESRRLNALRVTDLDSKETLEGSADTGASCVARLEGTLVMRPRLVTGLDCQNLEGLLPANGVTLAENLLDAVV